MTKQIGLVIGAIKGVGLRDFFLVFVLASTVIESGCASNGFNRGELTQQMGVTKPVYDDKQIKEAFGKKPNLPKPFKIGVYFKNPTAAKGAEKSWRWTEQNKDNLEALGQELKSEGIVSDVFPILNSLVQDEDIKSLRMISAQHQADALLVIQGAGEVDHYTNGLAWTYIALLPALFVHGSETDVLFLSSASLWDVKNEYLYLTAEAEGFAKDSHAAAFGKSDKELLEEAKTKSLMNLKQQIKKMVAGTKLKS